MFPLSVPYSIKYGANWGRFLRRNQGLLYGGRTNRPFRVRQNALQEVARGTLMYKIVQTLRLYEQIVQQIEDSILKGDLKGGEQLPAERELAQQFGVSRTAVREAMKTLREKGLVEAYAGRGTFVTNETARSMRHTLDRMMRSGPSEGAVHLVEVREILEPEIAALAAKCADEDARSAMRESITVMDAARLDPEGF